MPTIDAGTIIILNATVALLMVLALRAARRSLPQEHAALQGWTAAYLLIGIGSVLFLTRGYLPPLFSITLANSSLTAGLLLFCRAFFVFRGQPPRSGPLMAAIIFCSLLYACLTHLAPSYAGRVLVLALAGVGSYGAIFYLYLVCSEGRLQMGERITVAASSLSVIAYALRFNELAAPPPDTVAPIAALGGNYWLTAYLVLANIAQFLFASALLVLTQERIAQKLRYVVAHDDLTETLSRQEILKRLEKATRSVLRNADRYAVIMLDMDHFKAVNDRYGHVVGDAVLKAVAACIRAELRMDSHLGRYGGEEFLIVARIRGAGEGRTLAERVRRSVERTPIATAAGPVQCTVSAGVEELSAEPPPEQGAALERADAALYAAKRGGRNRVYTAGDSEAAETSSMASVTALSRESAG